ncbi:hypothetical protein TRFO_15586 [Tritrichomonas foetus]|uniref:Copine C-terminal domain-containing protein n=1 Tax=Tritrichomonas foetus TaxID=1144522 RepID=A0A1J4KSJ2_9EUKA|nr:hypothetical protein TRFO_15586 [Tritrichomonas foetus]|eukprot:OHT14074.1 hypothetical protein TRFO_15586 [Tritrichomonas foetus]
MDCFVTQEYRRLWSLKSVTAHINASKPLIQNQTAGTKIINIHVAADNLPNDGTIGSDYICVMSVFGPKGWEKYARTEVSWEKKNMCQPTIEWIQPFSITYDPEGLHLLHFEIYQITSDFYSLKHQKRIGECDSDISTLMREIKRSEDFLKVQIHPFYEDGVDSFHSEHTPYLKIRYTDVNMKVSGSFFIKAAFQSKCNHRFFKPSIFFTIEKDNIPFFMSDTQKLEKKCSFEMIELSQQLSCGENLDSQLKLNIFENSKKVKAIGSFFTTINELSGASESDFEIKNEKGCTIGTFIINFIGKSKAQRIDDLQLRGISVQSCFALDFSAGKSVCDSYRMVLNGVGDSLNSISQIKPYRAFGFGIIDNQKQGIFSITKEKCGEFSSVQKIMDKYRSKLFKCVIPQTAKLYPVIKHTKQKAIEKWNQYRIFTIVTIITDGNITDVQKTIDKLAECDDVPICYIIVTIKSKKNPLRSALCQAHGKVIHSNGTKTKRRVFKMLYYANKFVNQPHNLEDAAHAATKMIHEWADLNGLE